MNNSIFRSLGSILNKEDISKLKKIDNPEVHSFISEYIQLCSPERVTVHADTAEDLEITRKMAIRHKEEAELAKEGHTIHFDGYYDQARDKEKTRFLLPEGKDLGPEINTINREKGINEIREIMNGIMEGHHLHIKFYCLGPVNSPFSIPCIQLTDSSYVAHSEDILYRQGYSEFLKMKPGDTFFKFVHSEGKLEEAGLGLMVSSNIEDRRIYIDLEDDLVYCANTQYAGNTIGLKKLAMRLAINRAAREGWLTEHMLVMAVNGPAGRKTYLTGAFPSMCGKTSTAMVEGENIVGDDIAYLRNIGEETRAVNVEAGIFGIIDGINPDEDPIQWEAITSPQEVIFTNQLVTGDGRNYWNGKPGKVPSEGYNHSGKWFPGKKDRDGNEIKPSHKNARFTFRIDNLSNADSHIHEPDGVPVKGIIYGGRDSDTSVPVKEAFDWEHGIIMYGACLESETTAATLGKEGVRKFNPMSNLDFLSLPIGKYIQNNLDFGQQIDDPPSIFAVNYFLSDENGEFLNDKNDKKLWLKWMGLRINDEVKGIKTPTGYLPFYDDIRALVQKELGRDYSLEDYHRQFKIRIPENLAKLERMKEIFTTRVTDTPAAVMRHIEEQKERLLKARGEFGDYVLPESFVQ
ncbi:MAG: phosphoenolpyruvate carboxykinase (GTP) [Candidatus Krumholzibacteriota bacterium]